MRYHDWLLHDCEEVILDCNSSGIPHQHAMDKLIARKIVT
jgi:tellurite methyltransferase